MVKRITGLVMSRIHSVSEFGLRITATTINPGII